MLRSPDGSSHSHGALSAWQGTVGSVCVDSWKAPVPATRAEAAWLFRPGLGSQTGHSHCKPLRETVASAPHGGKQSQTHQIQREGHRLHCQILELSWGLCPLLFPLFKKKKKSKPLLCLLYLRIAGCSCLQSSFICSYFKVS